MSLRILGDIHTYQIVKTWHRLNIKGYLFKGLGKSREEGMEYVDSFTSRGHLLFNLEFYSNRLRERWQNPHEEGELTVNRGENQEVSPMDESDIQAL